jgi:hypothetical protein
MLYRNDSGAGFTVNGDGKLDVGEVDPSSLVVYLQQPDGTFQATMTKAIQGGQALATGDVNKDGMPDIYVLQGKTNTSTNAPDTVFLNNGTGTDFTSMSVPSTSLGAAEAVTAIDYDGNKRTDFIVQNGNAGKRGPTQLIAFFRA